MKKFLNKSTYCWLNYFFNSISKLGYFISIVKIDQFSTFFSKFGRIFPNEAKHVLVFICHNSLLKVGVCSNCSLSLGSSSAVRKTSTPRLRCIIYLGPLLIHSISDSWVTRGLKIIISSHRRLKLYIILCIEQENENLQTNLSGGVCQCELPGSQSCHLYMK